ncbi:hypothetical protein C942_00541 [Photobacterium marinum]|uniref:Peptidase C39-like domain-containing protein n=1 Tax=Photobacterium marinum TaxID=1056511 RepID=L8JAL9_9GAMM|nr:hypothetical protein [Photobacterium marinum]ELR65915.1 hypothetical protein C942_00541 [Photobacterium marinum]
MKVIKTSILGLLFLLLFLPQASAKHRHHSPDRQLPVTQLTPRTDAVVFEQISFDLEIGKISNSDWGQLRVKPDRLKDRFGKAAGPGYINVFTYTSSRGGQASWVIDNLFVPGSQVAFKSDRRYSSGWNKGNQHPDIQDFSGRSPSQPEATVYFDLRPGIDGQGQKKFLRATVLFSQQPLPTIVDIAQLANRFVPQDFAVNPAVVNSEGAGHIDGRISPVSSSIPNSLTLGRPPQPVSPTPGLPDDLLFPIQIIQADQPNLDAGRNQCIPIAHANALQYLEDRYDNLPLLWRLPQLHIRGIGKVSSAGDVLFWVAEPENSLVANIDSYSRRAGVLDLNSGGYTSFCGLIRGVFGYLNDSGSQAVTEFRHQGSDSALLGSGADCDNGTVLMGDITSTQEGANPTWEWIFDQLSQGRAVTILFSWYDINGDWQGGHSVRVYGAAKFNDKKYLYTLDDASQGDNFSNINNPRTQQWEVADTGQPGLEGIPDGRLNMNGMSWEIDFALSYETKPTLLIP